MPSSMMYYEDTYVVLPPDMQEKFVTQPELEQLLHDLLADIQDALPYDLKNLRNIDEQVQRLVKTACDLDCGDRGLWQWYVVRLEK
ncbi:chlororespiratory reduction protein 7 [Pseudanabaena sp. 'Roaring Creek']|uniref:chlororespiratory reduction protein 7 n=1 Tax=Pseudanabaena sp. 'Roaring Creek' TaxID=1681830 RepID=UPI0006D7C24A|nr:chlororespiratory reduction protein 7 [Pseudanabaena sp. 'Roaring Creek']